MTTPDTHIENIVVGAGLSGLAAALLLAEAGRQVRVLEAHDKPGGRIRSVFDDKTGDYVADLGPTWIWPGYQPVIARWLEKLDLQTFPHFDAGKAVVEFGAEATPEYHVIPGQEGNERVVGGSQALIDVLAARLPDGALRTNAPVRTVTVSDPGVELELAHETSPTLTCDRVIIATPPRVAAFGITWTPGLPAPLAEALMETPTWMAPHAKAAIVYDTPFWRDMGLSGRIASRAGPVVEGHDHVGPDGSPAALWGFIGWPHQMREELREDLGTEIRKQLTRCFGADSPEPRAIHIEDWALDPRVSTSSDLNGPMAHPEVRPDVLREPYGNSRVWFAGSETARISPGLIEGAFDAAERTVGGILQSMEQ